MSTYLLNHFNSNFRDQQIMNLDFHSYYYHLWFMPPGCNPYKYTVFFKKSWETLLSPKSAYLSRNT